MSETVTITLGLPPRALMPNARPHHHAKARAVKKYRRAACVLAQAVLPESAPWERATIRPTFYHALRRDRDGDNAVASLKSAIDGLVASGLIVDDSSKHLATLPPAFQIDKQSPRVELRIERGSE